MLLNFTLIFSFFALLDPKIFLSCSEDELKVLSEGEFKWPD